MTTEDPRAFLHRLRGVFHDEAEQQRYLADAWRRLDIVQGVVSRLRDRGVRRVLELGANPYLLTLLMRRQGGFELELANYFGEQLPRGNYTHVAELDGEKLEFPYAHFNIETDVFPYSDQSFDAVLFCEIIEHLLISPDHVMKQVARIVKPGGFVVITTPNATRLTNLYFLALGRNIWDGYSANGPYGRHNREYTLSEVQQLMDRHGFEPAESLVRNVQPLARRFTWLQKLRPDVWYEHLFVVGRRRAA